MAGVSASIMFSLSARLTGAALGGDTPQFTATVDRSLSFEAGTDAIDKTNVLYHATRTLAASGTEDLDLAGVLADAFGTTIAAAEIVGIVIEAASGNTNNVLFGPAASAGFVGPFGDVTDRLKVEPGECVPLFSRRGWAVTATTADKLTVANSGAGTAVTYTITVLGRTVAA